MVATKKHQVIIVGGGIAGLSSAIFLSEIDGVEVTLLESQSKLGGVFRTQYSSTMFYYPERKDMDELEKKIGKQRVDDFHADLVSAITALETKHIVRGKYVSGFTNYEGNADILNTYALDLGKPIARKAAAWALKVAAPSAVSHLFLKEMKTMRNVIDVSDRLINGARDSHTKIVLKCRVKSVRSNCVVTEDGREFKFDSLVLASGGTGSNAELTQKVYGTTFVPHAFNQINDGLSLKSALENEWKYNKDLMAWFAEAVRLNSGDASVVLFLLGPAMLVVDSKGNRVYDEKLVYSIRRKTTAKYGELILVSDAKNMKRFIADSWILPAKYGCLIPPLRCHKHVKAKSVLELCRLLKANDHFKVDGEFETNFGRQFEQYQDFARNGKDTQFNRGARSGEFLDSKKLSIQPNRAMMPLEENSLVALKLEASTLDTCSGPIVDEHNRVLQESGVCVSNIYAVGNCSASILDGNYVAPGVPVSSAIVGAFRTCRGIKQQLSQQQ